MQTLAETFIIAASILAFVAWGTLTVLWIWQ